jgi:hypothetical protein
MLSDANLPPPWRPGRRSPAWLLRRPLTWLIAGEIVVMLALFGLAWHLLQTRPAPAPAVTALRPLPSPSASAPSTSAVTTTAVEPSPRPTPRAGLATDPATWIAQFAFINRDQSAWQKAEWNLLQAAVKAIRDYIEKVVLPAITRVEELSVKSS